MLIMGPSGAGKVGRVGVYSGASAAHYLVLFGVICAELSASSHGGSMVRVVVLSWLWLPRAYSSQLTPVIFLRRPFQEGVIKRPFKIGHGGMFFVPQRPCVYRVALSMCAVVACVTVPFVQI